MKTFIIFVIVLVSVSLTTIAQTKTVEEKTAINVATGDTTITKSIAISTEEDITPRNNILVINPLKFFVFYNLTYFHKLNDNVSLGAGLQFPTISGVSGWGINAEARFYPTGKNMRGFYIAPNISFNSISAEDESSNPLSIGGLVGWQWFPSDQFAMGLGIGIDYYTGSTSNNETTEDYNGILPAVRFDIGFAW